MLGKKLIKAAAGAGGVEKDEYFNQTTLLLHGDGNQGANNFSNAGPPSYLAFSDNSSNDFPITVNGDAYGTPFSPYSLSDGNWSNYFDGASYLQLASNAALNMESGDFTIEFWIYFNSIASYQTPYAKGYVAAGDLTIQTGNGNGRLIVYASGSAVITETGTATVGQWIHYALVRSGTTLTLYRDGVSSGSATNTTNFNSSSVVGIGGAAAAASKYPVNGYVSNLRAVKGRAVYGSNFTPSTSPLGVTSGGVNPPQGTETSLLTCQSNRFKDNSSNAFTITLNGTPAVKTLNPFNATVDGTTGSGYFGGTTDYILAPDDAAFDLTGDYTMEGWFYVPSTVSPIRLIAVGKYTSGGTTLYAATTSRNLTYYVNNSAIIATSTPLPIGQWNHVCVVRSGAGTNNTALFLNGSRIGQATNTTSITGNAASGASIGAELGTAFNIGQTMYASNVRIVKNAEYDPSQTTLTVPTATLTSDANTSLLTCQYQGTVRNVGFIDSSPNNFPITRNGNTTQGTFSPFSVADGEWSNYFDGSGDYLTLPSDAAFAFDTGDYTIEFWYYANSSSGQGLMCTGTSSQSTNWQIIVDNSTAEIVFQYTASSAITGPVVTTNAWTHIAATRSGTNVTLWVNGVSAGTATSGADLSSQQFFIGRNRANTLQANGYISNARLLKGTALYTAAFTPPTAPLTAIANTSLLTCQSNRFVDNSSNGFTLTPVGNVAVQPYSPFAPSAAYSPSANGGSAYFDGTGDYLTAANDAAFSAGTGDFTLEGWLYTSDTTRAEGGSSQSMCNIGGIRLSLNSSTGVLSYQIGASGVNGSEVAQQDAWNHFVIVRSGSDLSIFLNGVRADTRTDTTNLTSQGCIVGANTTTTGRWLGYLASIRFVKGTAVYDPTQTTLTVPTAPLTAISGTSLLCNFTNAGIFDNTGKNVLETVGNAQVNTDSNTVKYGTGSMKFDGTGDWLLIPHSPNQNMGGGSFSFEAWVYVTTKSNSVFISKGSSTAWEYFFGYDASIFRLFYNGNSNIVLTDAISLNTWHFVSFVRDASAGTITAYVDGSSVGSASYTGTYTSTANLVIGAAPTISGYVMKGYIDDVRLTKGVARDGTVVPTKAFPDQ